MTREERELGRWRRKAAAGPLSLDERSLVALLELADGVARSILERRPAMSRARAEIVRDRWYALRAAGRMRRHV